MIDDISTFIEHPELIAQRIGRSNHRMNEPSRALLVPAVVSLFGRWNWVLPAGPAALLELIAGPAFVPAERVEERRAAHDGRLVGLQFGGKWTDGTGHTDNFAPLALAGARRGETGEVRITGRDGDRLTAVWA